MNIQLIDRNSKNALGQVSFILFCLSLLWIVFAVGRVTFTLGIWKYVPSFFLFSLAVIHFFIHTAKQEIPLRHDFPLLKLGALHVLLTVIPSVFWSRGSDTAFLIMVNLSFLALMFLSLNLIDSERKIRLLMILFAAALAAVSVLGILEYFGLIFVLFNWRYDQIGSTFFHPNIYSGFLILMLPSCYMLILTVKRRVLKATFTLVAVLGLANLILARSRASLLAHFIALLVLAFFLIKDFSPRRQKKGLALKLAILILLFVVSFIAILLLNPAIQKKIAGSLSEEDPRFVSYPIALKIWTQSPATVVFGNGIGSFIPLYYGFKPAYYRARTFMRSWDAVHNEYLELLVDGGVVSLLAFLLLVAYTVIRAFKTIGDKSIDRRRRLYALGFFLAVLSFLIDGLFSTNMRTPVTMVFFFLMLSLLETLGAGTPIKNVLLGKLFVNPKTNAQDQSDPVKRVIVSLSVIFLVAANLLFLSRLASEYWIGRVYDDRVEVRKRIEYLDLAQDFYPSFIVPPYKLSETFLAVGDYARFFESAKRVEDMIPNFKSMRVLMGMAETLEGKYREAERYLSGYLSIDQYDMTAEAVLIYVYGQLDEWDGVVRIFKELIEGDYNLMGSRQEKVLFLEGIERVKVSRDGDKSTLEYGTRSMEAIVRNLLADGPVSLPQFQFRFHYVCGKTYYALRLPELALRHFRAGYRFLPEIGQKLRDLNPEEARKLAEQDADVSRYFDFFGMMREVAAELIKRDVERNSFESGQRMKRYLEIFAEREVKETLLQTYLKQRKFKNYRRLKDLNIIIPYTQ